MGALLLWLVGLITILPQAHAIISDGEVQSLQALCQLNATTETACSLLVLDALQNGSLSCLCKELFGLDNQHIQKIYLNATNGRDNQPWFRHLAANWASF